MDSNWIIAIATALYVVLTVFICVSNAISARAARKQTEELILQRELSFRPYIQISFEIIRGALLCFKIKNTGNQAAFETKVRVNDEFIQSLDDLEREGLGELNRAAFFLQRIRNCCLLLEEEPSLTALLKLQLYLIFLIVLASIVTVSRLT